MKINLARLMADVKTYATYGACDQGGVTRPSFSEADYHLREKFINDLKAMGLEVTIDPIANIWGSYAGQSEEAPIVLGSHLDTVTNGGKYDGALGVLVAKEIIQTLIDNQITLYHPLEIVSFTAEEPNDFNLSTMGSRTLLGKLELDVLMKTRDSTGRLLKDAVKKAGGSLENLPMSKEIKAFVELHIEQGKRLEERDLSIGIVDNIVGIYRDRLLVSGEPNHAGTTFMQDRKDALTAASEIVLAIEQIAWENRQDVVATVGKFSVSPNAANIIPGEVDLIVEIRSRSKEKRYKVRDLIHQATKAIVKKRNVSIQIENILDQPEFVFDADIVNILKQAAQQRSTPFLTLSSMAGHDAAHLSELAKTAMIFVKSIGGISHSPEEYSKEEDIEIAANVLLESVFKIDRQLKREF